MKVYTEEELTPTFPARVRPVNVGVYQIDYWILGFDRFAFWNGVTWGLTARTAGEAGKHRNKKGCNCYSKHFNGWRGLTAPAKEEA